MGRILLTSTTEEILNLEKPAVLISDLPELDFTKDFEKKNILLTGLHGLKRDEIKKDLNNLDLIYNNLIDEVILALNNFHEVNESKRYWEIIIGHWLFFYIRTILPE